MGGIKLSIHPLFFLFGLFYAFTGKIFVFLTYTICAVVHEIGHSIVASSMGYKLNKITLMPFGAIVTGNVDGLKLKDEIKIALAGPFINLAIAILFIAVWWIFPESYAFTDVAVEACLSMALVNFLPIFPLDGGRITLAMLTILYGKKKALVISKIIGVIFSVALLVGFILTCFTYPNFSLLFFSLFVLFGAMDREKENSYVRIYSAINEENLKRGMPFNKFALHSSANVKKLMSLLDYNAVNEVVIYDKDKPLTVLSQGKIVEIIESGELYAPIDKYLAIKPSKL